MSTKKPDRHPFKFNSQNESHAKHPSLMARLGPKVGLKFTPKMGGKNAPFLGWWSFLLGNPSSQKKIRRKGCHESTGQLGKEPSPQDCLVELLKGNPICGSFSELNGPNPESDTHMLQILQFFFFFPGEPSPVPRASPGFGSRSKAPLGLVLAKQAQRLGHQHLCWWGSGGVVWAWCGRGVGVVWAWCGRGVVVVVVAIDVDLPLVWV